nr:chaplin [Streptomyces sp. 2231.1]
MRGSGLATATLLVFLGGAAAASADSGADAAAVNSPGVLSGNVVLIPVHIPINICGDTVNVIGALTPAFGTVCANGVHSDK